MPPGHSAGTAAVFELMRAFTRYRCRREQLSFDASLSLRASFALLRCVMGRFVAVGRDVSGVCAKMADM